MGGESERGRERVYESAEHVRGSEGAIGMYPPPHSMREFMSQLCMYLVDHE